ncbi:Regulator of chromosome condensation (RCC1) family protein [Zostera marina]|uniref:Regulator of chromosome condensation (RCC1) family protein n=1 Tax=Zostera marina TaxID=29655 RepID=A0A0K9NWE2_ZOSMR|nr:Regulator of chromosome condensation (RCC1) family protein [Zostera marina]
MESGDVGEWIPLKCAIYTWGYNKCGQTARKGKEPHLRIPWRLSQNLFRCPDDSQKSRWLDVACGWEHTAAVASDGSLFTWGSNDCGQLGDGTENSRKQPKKVRRLDTEFVTSVSCGAHCMAVIADSHENSDTTMLKKGRLWVWGQNQGSNIPRLFWGVFNPNTVIQQVSCGFSHTVALSEDGLLQAWGYNEYGQLGRGFTCDGLQKAQLINNYERFLDEAPELVTITQISCGEYHTAAISEIGDVYTWGLGGTGQLGHCSLNYDDRELLPRRVVRLEGIFIKDIACGGVHTCCVTSNGALYAWGGSILGQLGLGPQNGCFSLGIQNGTSIALRSIPILVIPSGVALVTCGHCHTLISMKNGMIYGCGYNSYGQASSMKSTYSWYPTPIDWCIGDVKRLAADGGHSVVLTDVRSLKGICEFKLTEIVSLANLDEIQEVASRYDSDCLARFCEKLRDHLHSGGDFDFEVEDDV